MDEVKRLEKELARELRKAWSGWSTFVEYGLGGDAGAADSFISVEGFIVPCELKVAEVSGGLIKPRKIRPAQIGWHWEAHEAGVFTLFLFGVWGEHNGIDLYVSTIDKMSSWKRGLSLSDGQIVFVGNSKSHGFKGLESYIRKEAKL